MKSSIFEYRNYKEYLNDLVNQKGRGEKSKIASFLKCHNSYVTQVLEGNGDFSLEQASKINQYLAHTQEQSHFFLLLVSFSRSGTKDLKDYYLHQIEQICDKRLVLKDRLEYKKSLTKENQPLFYSAWYFVAVHSLLAINNYQTVDAISDYLNLPRQKVSDILETLVNMGLAIQEQNKYSTSPINFHLGNDSPMISKHHANWKMQALQSLDRESKKDLHYSSIVTITESDAIKIKSQMIKAIEEIRSVVKEAQEEALYCYALDLFEVGNQKD